MTTEDLYNDIDWRHIHKVTSLHFTCVLCKFIPQLNHLCPKISNVFHAPPVAQHRMRDGQKWVQPLGTNAECKIETKGMKQCLLDFDAQMAIKGEVRAGTLLWACGDGGSFATVHRLKKYLLPTNHNVYKKFQNRLFTIEVWHSKSTNLNTMVTNFYGHKTSKDPSSLSCCASATNMHCPPNTQSCNFYPTAHSMQLFWKHIFLISGACTLPIRRISSPISMILQYRTPFQPLIPYWIMWKLLLNIMHLQPLLIFPCLYPMTLLFPRHTKFPSENHGHHKWLLQKRLLIKMGMRKTYHSKKKMDLLGIASLQI